MTKSNQFNSAIENSNYNVAWSNPNFELWLLSHFKRVNRYISKDNVLDELNKEFQKNGLGKYSKNDPNIFEILLAMEKYILFISHYHADATAVKKFVDKFAQTNY